MYTSTGDGSKIGTCGRPLHLEGVTIEDDFFIGHNASFINDKIPAVHLGIGQIQTEGSVVMHVPRDNAVVAGAPARPVKDGTGALVPARAMPHLLCPAADD